MLDLQIKNELISLTQAANTKKRNHEWTVFQKQAKDILIAAARSGDSTVKFEFNCRDNGTKAATMLTELGFVIDQRSNTTTGGTVVNVKWH